MVKPFTMEYLNVTVYQVNFSRRLGFGALNGGTAQRMTGKPIYGNASPAWYACDIGADFNWESKGWVVKFEPKVSDIRVGIILM